MQIQGNDKTLNLFPGSKMPSFRGQVLWTSKRFLVDSRPRESWELIFFTNRISDVVILKWRGVV